jgi:two-component system chemotaxis response regulator CheY
MATILAVDDSNSLRRMVVQTLEQAGHEVVEAGDGRSALDAAKRHRCDLALLDVNMPRMDGISLTQALRGLDAYRSVPILILTTESGRDYKERGKQAGATGWLVKPFSPDQLLTIVDRVLA